jgi:hypothetical protein
LYDHRRNLANPLDVTDQLVFAFQEAAIHEVVALDARHRDGEVLFTPLVQVLFVDMQVAGGRLPNRPGARRFHSRVAI